MADGLPVATGAWADEEITQIFPDSGAEVQEDGQEDNEEIAAWLASSEWMPLVAIHEGCLLSEERAEIFEETMCTVTCRQRKGWRHSHFSGFGPPDAHARAKDMALEFIGENAKYFIKHGQSKNQGPNNLSVGSDRFKAYTKALFDKNVRDQKKGGGKQSARRLVACHSPMGAQDRALIACHSVVEREADPELPPRPPRQPRAPAKERMACHLARRMACHPRSPDLWFW